MREVVTTVYHFSELSDTAQLRAVEAIARRITGAWWDSSDDEALHEAAVYGFAEAIGYPGHDRFGEADFPGIDGVKLESMDLGRMGEINFVGVLTERIAPKLPWTDIDSVQMLWDHRICVDVVDDVVAVEPDVESTMQQAVRDAMHAGWKAAETELQHRGSEEEARDMCNANDEVWEFDEDGDPVYVIR